VRVKQKVVFSHVHEIVINLSSKYKVRSVRKILRFCLGVWKRGDGETLDGGKHKGKWKNLSYCLNEYF